MKFYKAHKIIMLAVSFWISQAIAQTTIARDHFLTGFLSGCEHSKAFLNFEQKICRNTAAEKLNSRNCKTGEVVPVNDTVAIADFKFHKDYYEYKLNFAPGAMMLGPLDVSVLTFYVGNSNGIRASELQFRNIKTAKEAKGMLLKSALKIQGGVNEVGDEVVPKLHQSKTKPVNVTLVCDLSD